MLSHKTCLAALLAALLLFCGCKKDEPLPTIEIAPGPSAQTALQNAIDELCREGGGTIQLMRWENTPATTYYLNAPIEINQCENVKIQGSQWGSVWRFDSTLTETGILITESENIQISNINAYSALDLGVHIQDAANLTFENFSISGLDDSWGSFDSTELNNGCHAERVENLQFLNCRLTANARYGLQLDGCQRVVVDRSQIGGIKAAFRVRNSQNVQVSNTDCIGYSGLCALAYTDPAYSSSSTANLRFQECEFVSVLAYYNLQDNHPFEGINLRDEQSLLLLGVQNVELIDNWVDDRQQQFVHMASLQTVRAAQEEAGVATPIDYSNIANPHTEQILFVGNNCRELGKVYAGYDSTAFLKNQFPRGLEANVLWDGLTQNTTSPVLCFGEGNVEMALGVLNKPELSVEDYRCNTSFVGEINP
ncbi:MAG: right-handed parallel beta-helix repeat-containing protein [Bacteroidota bacterium]